MADEPGWDDLPISERVRETVHALGWREPTPIQQAVVPQLVMGRDIIGRAQTGSGKTAAFGLVLTDQVKAPGLQALVLAPTRELVVQIAEELNRLAGEAPFEAVAIYGGMPYEPQLAALARPGTCCIVATTGRLLDLLNRKQVALDKVRYVVIDEADRMLDLGFLPEVERVLKLVPGARQTALFTATMPKKVALLAHRYMSHPREIEVGARTPETADHYRVDVPSLHKLEALVAILAKESPVSGLIFTRTREGSQKLARELHDRGVPAVAFHGDLEQRQRERVVADLKAGHATIVVATDVAARGLDIPVITHVVNYDVPEEAEQYVHRAGRTARAGRNGRVFTIVTENDGTHVAAAQRAARVALQPYPMALQVGDEVIQLGAPIPPKPEMRGGNATGARRKNSPTPPNPLGKRLREPPTHGTKADRHDLPPSRREKKR